MMTKLEVALVNKVQEVDDATSAIVKQDEISDHIPNANDFSHFTCITESSHGNHKWT